MMSWNDGSVGLCAFSRKSFAIMMAESTLLKSWAMPPASWPTVSIFCDWLIWFSSARRSVVSSMCTMAASASFSAASTGVTKNWPQRSLAPSSATSTGATSAWPSAAWLMAAIKR